MINEILNTLAGNASKNFKVEFLTKNKDNELLREVIRLATDPFTQFYIRKIPQYAQSPNEIHLTLDEAVKRLFELSSRTLTGHAAIDHLRSTLSGLSEGDAKVIERIIQKDLKSGFGASTANKVWPFLIAEYPVMLCSPFDVKLVNKIKFPAIAQKKEDGMRFNAIVRGKSCEFRSRNGKEIQLLGNLEQEFIELAAGVDSVFDGELLVMLDGDLQFADRQTGNGILNKANKGTITEKEAKQVHAQLWDVIPYVMFTDGYAPFSYESRFAKLQNKTIPPKLHIVESTIVNSLEEAQEIFESYLNDGFEGIILKDKSGVWEDKRSKTQIKFKGEEECDLLVVGTTPHKKNPAMLGSLMCESADGVVKVSVGSGFTDATRSLPESFYIGKIVAVKYNMRIKNSKGEQSLFLPILIEVREDKDVADTADLIK